MSADPLLPGQAEYRPRLSRYDRPALSLGELLKAEGSDFVHVAAWTMLDRRATPLEHDRMLALLANRGKPAVLAALQQSRSDGQVPVIDGLSRLLLVQRRAALPLIGPIVVRAIDVAEAWPVLAVPGRIVGKVPRWIGWLGRRMRRIVTRAGVRFRLPTPAKLRHKLGVGHAPPDPQMSPRAAQLYRQLCTAIDANGGAA